jgi:hypothetical protein
MCALVLLGSCVRDSGYISVYNTIDDGFIFFYFYSFHIYFVPHTARHRRDDETTPRSTGLLQWYIVRPVNLKLCVNDGLCCRSTYFFFRVETVQRYNNDFERTRCPQKNKGRGHYFVLVAFLFISICTHYIMLLQVYIII